MSTLDITKDSQFGSLLFDSQAIIEQARSTAYRSVNILLVQRNWLYVKKCVSKYPKECYKFISDQRYSEVDGQWVADDDVVAMNEIMDLFDEYIYRGKSDDYGCGEKMNWFLIEIIA